ncbi:MAG: transcriptional regulator-like protein [Chthonomonadales bacterium]|nr:transcriptional regulator-like protein [Chthonomonadales bacterium]
MSQHERILWLDAQIRAERYPNPGTVVARWGVNRRTAFADHDYLQDRLHAPIATDRNRGWYYTSKTFILPFLALTERDATTLRRTLLAAEEYLSAADAEPVRRIAELLTSYIPSSLPAGHERVRGSIQLLSLISGTLLADCEHAVQNRQRIHLLYHGANRNALTDRIVQPYDLLSWRGEPHLIAFCELRQEMRQFFLGRVRQWEMLPGDRAYVPQELFDIDAYLARGFGLRHGDELVRVRVRFSPHQARWIRERRYHASQQTEEQTDGSLVLSMEVAGTEEVRRWLLGYGADVEVLEPASLRSEIQDELHKLLRIYGAPSLASEEPDAGEK